MAVNSKQDKNLFSLSGYLIPVFIVLGGALVFMWGVSRLLNPERNYKTLVREMRSKTFGNRWVSAFELAKILNASQIPREEIPWLVNELNGMYNDSREIRTKNFILVSLSALTHPSTKKTFLGALKETDPQLLLSALKGLGGLGSGEVLKLNLIKNFLKHKDSGLRLTALMTLVHHKGISQSELVNFLDDATMSVRYAASWSLISYKEKKALPTLKEILLLKGGTKESNEFNGRQIEGLKRNVLFGLSKNYWPALEKELRVLVHEGGGLGIKAQELLDANK